MDAGPAVAGARKKLEDALRRREELFQQWNAANQEVLRYQAFMDVWTEFTGLPPDPSQIDSELLSALQESGSLADAAATVIERSVQKEVETRQLVNILEAAGKVKGKNTYSTVVKTLQRHTSRFDSPRRGVWRLRGNDGHMPNEVPAPRPSSVQTTLG